MDKNDFPYPIYDSHHHLWNLDLVHYPWLASKGVMRFFGDPTPIQKNYLTDDFKADIGSLPVEKSVHIQVGAADTEHLLESQVAQQFADESGLANAIIAFAAIEKPELTKTLDQLQKLNNFRGLRQIVGRSPKEDKQTGTGALLQQTAWRDGLRELEKRSLTFDLQLIPDQMHYAAEVFSEVPDLSVVICHCGSPWYRDAAGWEMWKTGLAALAKLPNVYCKISGLTMFDHQWSTERLKPIVDVVLDTFSVKRCMFGSNFPVDKLHTSYDRLWWAYLELANSYHKNLNDTAKRGLFKDNCKEFYSIG